MIDTFFLDTPSTLLDPRGIPYPQCWVEDVEVTPATEEEPVVTEVRLKAEHQAYPWTPAAIGSLPDGRNVYFEIRATEPTEYRANGTYLASSYYELATLHPEISRCCAEVEYEDEKGTISRCKAVDLPVGKAARGVYAPAKYAGVDSPTEPVIGDAVKEVQELKVENAELRRRLEEGEKLV